MRRADVPRFYTPLERLADAWQGKLLVASVGGFLLQALDVVAGLYGRLLLTDPVLVLLIATLLFVDVVTGIGAAVKRGERVRSKAFRRTGWKVLEYTAIGLVGVMLANAFARTSVHLLTDGLDDVALLYIATTEALSILENITGSREAALRLLRRLGDLARGRVREVEEVVAVEPAPAAPPAAPPATGPAE